MSFAANDRSQILNVASTCSVERYLDLSVRCFFRALANSLLLVANDKGCISSAIIPSPPVLSTINN